MRSQSGTSKAPRFSWRLLALLGATLALLAVGIALPRATAQAEPFFSVRDGYKCSKCHVNRTGGGKRTDYAKVYLETRAAMDSAADTKPEGDAKDQALDFGHGRLSQYFSISADLRQLAEYRHENGGENSWQFGRQAACESCHRALGGGGKLVELYEQLELKPGAVSVVLGQSLMPGVTNRESYGLLEMDTLNSYVKAGIFRMPAGLRNTYDDPYLHGTVRYGSLSVDRVGLEAVRGDGVEFGVEPGPFSLVFSVTNPGAYDALASAPPRDKRIHLSGYAVGSWGLAGITVYSDPVRETLERTFTGIYGGTSIGRLTGLVELDRYKEDDPTTNTTSTKQALLAQVDFLLSRGQNIKWQYEAFDPDTAVDNNISDRTSVVYEPFLSSVVQARAGVRRLAGPREVSGLNGTTVFMELHLVY